MKLTCYYTMSAEKPLPIKVPLELTVDGVSVCGTADETDEKRYTLELNGPLDHTEIEFTEETVEVLGCQPVVNNGLVTEATKRFLGVARFVARYLTFQFQSPVSVSGHLGRNSVTPDDDRDREFLAQFPTSP